MAFYPFGPAPVSAGLAAYQFPAGVTAESVSRSLCGGYTSVLVSGTVYATQISLPAGLTVSNLAVLAGNTAFATVTHGWMALIDPNGLVQAVTADETAPYQTSFAEIKRPVIAPYTTPANGSYFLAFCVNAATMGVLVNGPGNIFPNGIASILCGTAGTAATTPPAPGTPLAVTYASGNPRFYGGTA